MTGKQSELPEGDPCDLALLAGWDVLQDQYPSLYEMTDDFPDLIEDIYKAVRITEITERERILKQVFGN